MNNPPTYRSWQPGDDDILMPLIEKSGFLPDIEWYRDKFEDAGVMPEGILLAFCDGALAGHLMCYDRRLMIGDRQRRLGGLGVVYVENTCRGLGIGKTLTRQAIAYHRERGNHAVMLFTLTTLLPAYPMYQKEGFDTAVVRETYRRQVTPVGGPEPPFRAYAPGDRDRARRMVHDYAILQTGYTVEYIEAFPSADIAAELRVVEIDGRLSGIYRRRGTGAEASISNLAFVEPITAAGMLKMIIADLAQAEFSTVEIWVNNGHVLTPALINSGFVEGDPDPGVLMMKPLQDNEIFPPDAHLEMECCKLW